MNQITPIGIDLGKSVFYVHAVDRRGKAVERTRLTRSGLRRYMLRVPPCLVGMEACGGSQHWARWLKGYGHEAKPMPAQYVKAYVKTNKNDWRADYNESRPHKALNQLTPREYSEQLMQHDQKFAG